MLTESYIEELLVDVELADQVWEAWNAEDITDDLAAWACRRASERLVRSDRERLRRQITCVKCPSAARLIGDSK